MLPGSGQHLAALSFIGRGHDDHIGYTTQKAQVKHPCMSCTVCAYQPGTVDGKGDIKVLQCDVVYQLVIGALQEGGIDRDDRLDTLTSQSGGKGQGVLFGDTDIKIAVRESF